MAYRGQHVGHHAQGHTAGAGADSGLAGRRFLRAAALNDSAALFSLGLMAQVGLY